MKKAQNISNTTNEFMDISTKNESHNNDKKHWNRQTWGGRLNYVGARKRKKHIDKANEPLIILGMILPFHSSCIWDYYYEPAAEFMTDLQEEKNLFDSEDKDA